MGMNCLIDKDGFRANVGIILCNDKGKLLWAKRVGQKSWQFPQGGIQKGESSKEALFRELKEEVGLEPEAVEILAKSSKWLRYRLPQQYIRHNSKPLCIGQKQRWYLLKLKGDESAIRFDQCEKPEFDHWKWVNYWKPISEIIFFKKRVYQRVLEEFRPIVVPDKTHKSKIDQSAKKSGNNGNST
jgi:putative (di)nucleoside polyphosphate hydrolase